MSANRPAGRLDIFGDFKNRVQTRQFKNPENRFINRCEDEPLAPMAGRLKGLQQTGDSRAVDHGNAGQIDNDSRPLAGGFQQYFTRRHRIFEVDIAFQGDNNKTVFFGDDRNNE